MQKSRKTAFTPLTAERATETIVFSGGASNTIDARGDQLRNDARDGLNGFFNEVGIPFSDPQIHVLTHGRSYTYDVDGPAEKAARAAAKVLIYQVGDDTLAPVTAMETVRDAAKGKPVIIWFTGERDVKGKPLFRPKGIDLPWYVRGLVPRAYKAHMAQYVRAGMQCRSEMIAFTKEDDNVRVCYTMDNVKEALRAFGVKF